MNSGRCAWLYNTKFACIPHALRITHHASPEQCAHRAVLVDMHDGLGEQAGEADYLYLSCFVVAILHEGYGVAHQDFGERSLLQPVACARRERSMRGAGVNRARSTV